MFINQLIFNINKHSLFYRSINFNRTLRCVRSCSSKPPIDLSDTSVLQYLEENKKEYWSLKTNSTQNRSCVNKLRELLPLVKLLEEKSCVVDNLKNLEEIGKGDSKKDKDMIELMSEEKEIYEEVLKDLDSKIIETIFDEHYAYSSSDTILEVSAGVGGQEAMLFAREMFDMYLGFAQFKGWESHITHLEKTGIGGIKKASAVFSGQGTLELLTTEGGVHRVQRIPVTEKGGRLHTSTITVAVLLQPTEIELNIPDRDLKIETKRSSGAGGQHVNTTDSAVRITHLPTGIAVECQRERNQIQNRKGALERLRALLYQQEEIKQEKDEKSSRKSQVGLGLRNEKIRTYNYQQDRITDHRIGASGGTIHGIENFMKGGESFDNLISKLRRHIKTQDVLQRIETLRQHTKKEAKS